MKVNKRIIFFTFILLILCLLSFLFVITSKKNETIACIYIGGNLYEKVELTNREYEKEIYIETQYGYNKLLIKSGKIGVSEADCPDKTCVNTGFTNSSSKPIICIPHRLEIIILDSEQIDGVVG